MTHGVRAIALAEGLWLFDGVPKDDDARDLLLRRHLAEIAGCAPEALDLRRQASGKPVLAGAQSKLFFSPSRRPGLLLVATHWDDWVGADLEPASGAAADDAVARAFFAGGEIAWLDSLTDGMRPLGFLRLWTAKEAVLKALGIGIIDGLAEPDLSAHLVSGQLMPVTAMEVAAGGHRWQVEWFSATCVQGPVIIAKACGLTCLFSKKRTL